MIPVEGSQVNYVGDEVNGLNIGDRGQVLASGQTMSHVAMRTGAHEGTILYLHNMDLVTAAQERTTDWETDFYDSRLVHCAVRETYDARGPRGLFKALETEGHLSTIAEIGDEAIQYVAIKIQQDPSIREVLAQLEEDDAADFLSFTAEAVVREALGD